MRECNPKVSHISNSQFEGSMAGKNANKNDKKQLLKRRYQKMPKNATQGRNTLVNLIPKCYGNITDISPLQKQQKRTKVQYKGVSLYHFLMLTNQSMKDAIRRSCTLAILSSKVACHAKKKQYESFRIKIQRFLTRRYQVMPKCNL